MCAQLVYMNDIATSTIFVNFNFLSQITTGETDKGKKKMLTWVNIAFADDIVSLVDISSGAKLSAMETTTKPARTIAR